jgi:bifunctional enzyme CysN/CysC
VTHDANLQCAGRGQAVILVMDREVDISRGDMLASAQAPVEMADQFEAHIVWMADAPMLPERQYHLTIGTQTVNVVVTGIKYQLNVNTLEHVAAETLPLNGIGVCTIKTDRPIAFDAYRNSREMGGFILVDKMSYQTVGAGMLNFALRRSANIHWQSVLVSKKSRGAMKGQKPCVFWLTGLSGAGKSTIANALDRYLHARGLHTYILDGDNLRHGLNKDLGFTDADRVENIRRAAEVARLMVDAGLIVIAAFISPFRQERDTARALFEPGEFFEIFVDTPLAVAEQRDPKGLYKKARAGTLPNFTGIDSPYEAPEHPELRLFTLNLTPESAAEAIAQLLNES